MVIFMQNTGLPTNGILMRKSLRVPLVVYDPRLKPEERNKVIDDFVLNIDIAPAIISAAGSEIPGAMQGKDFSELYLSRKDSELEERFLL